MADRIHLHAESHLGCLAHLPIDRAKVVIGYHGGYEGYYGEVSWKERAQRSEEGERRVLFLGMIRGYKAIDVLCRLVQEICAKGFPVTVAGMPLDGKLESKLRNLNHPNLNLVLRRLTEAEVHEMCSSHDIGLLCYRQVLTSGTLKLYCTYGMVIVAPDLNTIREEDVCGTFLYYPPDEPEEQAIKIASQLRRMGRSKFSDLGRKSLRVCTERGWSRELFDGLFQE
ncbi:MAG: hypothetical protein RLO51_24510 [Thalassobaculum sp.]|uniref:hypothetical protein n=1 Tax=Thalassobaculum sp. TaxID=2022740 RepID=UPI0032EB9CD1